MQIENGQIVPGIENEDVAGFRMHRSPIDKTLFNVYACSFKDELLVTIASDLNFKEASSMVESLNAPYDDTIPQVFETKEVSMQDGTIRYFQVEV